MTVNQVISKRRQKLQISYVKDGVMLQHKAIQLEQLQSMKDSNPGLNNDLGITITLAKISVSNKREERK